MSLVAIHRKGKSEESKIGCCGKKAASNPTHNNTNKWCLFVTQQQEL
jgi:hypothetical protein